MIVSLFEQSRYLIYSFFSLNNITRFRESKHTLLIGESITRGFNSHSEPIPKTMTTK